LHGNFSYLRLKKLKRLEFVIVRGPGKFGTPVAIRSLQEVLEFIVGRSFKLFGSCSETTLLLVPGDVTVDMSEGILVIDKLSSSSVGQVSIVYVHVL
jgi:hypothetical protein